MAKADPWLNWYWGKEGTLESGVAELEAFFKRNGVLKILDLGCGTGRHSLHFAKSGFEVYGFDRSDKAVNRAKLLFELEGLSAELRCWDMTATPYPYENGFFDAVVAMKVIHHTLMGCIEKIVAEIARITKVGGFLYLVSPTYEKAVRLKGDGVRSEEVEPGTFLPSEGEEKGILHHHFTREELHELLKGFDVRSLRVEEEHYHVLAQKKRRGN
jgi:SAM-dependent methyltransferase